MCASCGSNSRENYSLKEVIKPPWFALWWQSGRAVRRAYEIVQRRWLCENNYIQSARQQQAEIISGTIAIELAENPQCIQYLKDAEGDKTGYGCGEHTLSC